MNMAHHPSQEPLDQLDPHHDEHHHGHVILSPFTLVSVLAALLFFTGLTIFLSRLEIWFDLTFAVSIPNWFNVVIVLSIATVKSILVGMYFMQLKYDHPINSIVFLFCIFALALFLGFTMIDLGTRGDVYAYKGQEIQHGGMGINTSTLTTGGVPITLYWRQAELERLTERYGPEEGPRRYWEKYRLAHGYPEPVPLVRRIPSDPNISRPRTGMTPGLFDEAPEAPARRRGLRGAREVADPESGGREGGR
jgi:cytochrome c oxidase subunit IV